VGGRIGAELDKRDRTVNPRRGFRVALEGEVSPAIWDVPSTYGAGQALADAFLSASLPAKPTLALRVGGRKVWGEFPFFDAAYLGGHSTLTGYHSHRFAGDASLYGGAELRLTLSKAFVALPAEWGIYGGGDVGRVYLDGASPGGWHGSGGGGLWLAFLDRSNTMSVGFASSTEGTRLEAGAAFGW
jgi:outer membrane protein assembly factor BamA